MNQAEWTGIFGNVHLRLRGRVDGILRITRDLSGAFREAAFSAAGLFPEGEWTETARDGGMTFELPGLRVRLDGDTGALSFSDRKGKLLLREREDCPAELEETEIRHGVFLDGARAEEKMGVDGARSTVDPAETACDRTGVRGKLYFRFREKEALYGLGSHEEGTGNLRGHDRILYQHNLKAVVPVLVSTEGWAILFDMGCLMFFHDGAEGAFMGIDCADTLDYYFVYGGGTYGGLMEKLNRLLGEAPMLPRWALGFVQSKERYITAEELTGVAAEYRRRKIPLDLIVQDWQTWPDGQWGLKRYDRSRFPEGFPDRLHAMNVRVMLSVWPHMQGDSNEDRQEMLREGCMLGNQSTYNAFSEKARKIYFRQLKEGLLCEDIDAWWCDCTEPFEADWQGNDRPTDRERMLKNTGEAKKYLDPAAISLYSVYHSRGIYEGLRGAKPGQRVLNVTRSSWAGQRKYAAVTWSGDVCATWETLRRHIPEGMNFTATGEAFWNCDIGGFFSAERDPWFWKGGFPRGTKDPGYRELFVRWMQYACFLTLMRAHGTDSPREIWQFGDEGGRFYDAIALCIRMRYRLLAYHYSLMDETRKRGLPAVRVPALVFPEDLRLREIDHEMMIGRELLVCPVTRPMYYLPGGEEIRETDETAEVCLPAGFRWYAPDENKVYEGGQTVTVRAPLEKIPVFVRAGSVIPVSPVRQYTEEEADGLTEIVIFPGADGSFVFYDDDGVSYDYENGWFQRFEMVWNDRERSLEIGNQEGFMYKERRMVIRLFGGNAGQEIRYTGEGMTVCFPKAPEESEEGL